MEAGIVIRDSGPEDYDAVGQLTLDAYLALEGMPPYEELSGYYDTLGQVKERAEPPTTAIVSAYAKDGEILGSVTFMLDIAHYGAPVLANADRIAGIRMLAVAQSAQGRGIGRALTLECLDRARGAGKRQMLLHTTVYMQAAQKLYQALGFRRLPEVDFEAPGVTIKGFLLDL